MNDPKAAADETGSLDPPDLANVTPRYRCSWSERTPYPLDEIASLIHATPDDFARWEAGIDYPTGATAHRWAICTSVIGEVASVLEEFGEDMSLAEECQGQLILDFIEILKVAIEGNHEN